MKNNAKTLHSCVCDRFTTAPLYKRQLIGQIKPTKQRKREGRKAVFFAFLCKCHKTQSIAAALQQQKRFFASFVYDMEMRW